MLRGIGLEPGGGDGEEVVSWAQALVVAAGGGCRVGIVGLCRRRRVGGGGGGGGYGGYWWLEEGEGAGGRGVVC